MNKKFSTLVASLLLAGSFSVNAQTDKATALTDEHVYYLSASGNFQGIENDVLTEKSSAEELTTAYQWKAVKISYNGSDVYALRNVVSGKYITITGSNLTINKNPQYGALNASKDWAVAGQSGTLNVFNIAPITSTSVELNNNQGWRKGFALQAESADHKKVVAVEPNVFMNGIIKAYNAEAINEVGCGNVNSSESDSHIKNHLQKSKNLTGNMLLKVAGEWDGSALYDWKYVEGTQKWVLNEEVLAKFRASKFIVMDKDVYSNFATNVDGGSTKGYKFAVVTGAELINKEGDCDYVATTNTSVTHHVMNAVFNIKQDPTVPKCANDLIISLPQAYTWTDTNNDGKKEYSKAASNQTPYVAIFNFEGKYYLASTNVEKEAIDSHLALNDDKLVAQKDWAGKIVNIVSTANTSWTADSEEVSSKYVDGTVPEGQWIVQGSENEKTGSFSFKNRESVEDFELEGQDENIYTNFTIYKTATANQYEVVYNNGEEKADLVITNAPARANIFANYMNLDESLLKDQKFNISVVTDLFQNVYLAEIGNAKTVELTNDVENAGAWSLVKYNSDKNYEAGIEVADTIYHFNNDINYWNPKKEGGAGWDTYTDTLAMFAYTIQNEAGKY